MFPNASVAEICSEPPPVFEATKEHVKAPELLVEHVEGEVVCRAPPKAKVTVEDAANPAPDTDTVVPLGPVPGVGEIEGDVTVKAAVAESELWSVAVTVWAPSAELAGIVKEQLNEPEDVLQAEGEVVWTVPPSAIVTVDEEANPLPETVTGVPLGPDVGFREIAGEAALAYRKFRLIATIIVTQMT